MHFPWKTVGHDRQKQEIEQNILNNNIAHAYLFSGPKDTGKLYFSKEITKALLCPNRLCRTCSVCRQIDNLTHPDFLMLDMLYIDKVQDNWDVIAQHSNISQKHRASLKAKSDTIGVDTIRELQDRLQEKAFGKYKICIIHNIDRITPEATNAFLKTVEEPPKGVIFFFTASKESNLLPTFLSRVRVIRFNTLPNEEIQEKLIEKFGEVKHLKEILQYAQGRIGIAFKLANDNEAFIQIEKQYQEIQEVFERMNTVKRFAFAEKICENTEDLKTFFEQSYFYLRSKINPQNRKLADTIQSLEKTEKAINQNVNKRLALENLFLTLES